MKRRKGLRRTPLRRRSNKRARLMRRVLPLRLAFLEEQQVCCACPVYAKRPAAECHEVSGGSDREAFLGERLGWLALCHAHHRALQSNSAVWPVARQLALKAESDPEFYDLAGFNRIQNRHNPGATGVTPEEVERWLTAA